MHHSNDLILATYRLQLEPGFTFDDAAAVVPYLARLGVSDVYSSPVFEAAEGSRHGYDVSDPRRVRAALGGEEGRERLVRALDDHGLGLVADIVPNHLALEGNPWWTDVLARGRQSPYFAFFDLADEASCPDGDIVLPILAEPYGAELDRGALTLVVEGDRPLVAYGSKRFPVSQSSLEALTDERPGMDRDERDGSGTTSVATRTSTATVREQMTRLARRSLGPASMFNARLRLASPVLSCAASAARRLEGPAGKLDSNGMDSGPSSRLAAWVNQDPLHMHRLLEAQHYRLAWWRLARDESPYRRFFDINTLIGVRVDRQAVFEATHRRAIDWVRDGSISGIRVDHVDGLANPAAYLTRLQSQAPGVWIGVEKILSTGESLPEWPVDGTTGYEFGALVTRVLTAGESGDALTGLYERFTGLSEPFEEVAITARHEVLGHWLAGDVDRVAWPLHRLCQTDLHLRDFSRRDVTALVQELVAACPVYRTYVVDGRPSGNDARALQTMFGHVRQTRPDLPAALVDFAADLLRRPPCSPDAREFVERLQQLCTAVAAKGMEDTAFYRYNRFISHNEVGADPSRLSSTVADFHRQIAAWQREQPRGMRSTMTHDSKRSEDVRARLTVLSECADEWATRVEAWRARSEAWRIDGQPDRNFEYYLYQTLAGAWPLSRERMQAHAEKAMREAKLFTNWSTPSPVYERAVHHFIDSLYADPAFIQELTAFVDGLHPADWIKALAQVLLKLTVPGVPDFYQGSELWTLQLCDPDNRTPVDYERRRRLFDECAGLTADAALARMDEGLPKLWTVMRTLALKWRSADLADTGSVYEPLKLEGDQVDHVIAFRRGDSVAVIVPTRTRHIRWDTTAVRLPIGTWTHVLTGDEMDGGPQTLSDLFNRFPVALLEQHPR